MVPCRLLQTHRSNTSYRWLLASAIALGCSGRSSTTIIYQIAAGGAGGSPVASSLGGSGAQAVMAAGGATGGNTTAPVSGGAGAPTSGGSSTAAMGGVSTSTATGGAANSALGGTPSTGAGGAPASTGGASAGGGAGPFVCLEQPRDPLAAPCTKPYEQLWRGHCYAIIDPFTVQEAPFDSDNIKREHRQGGGLDWWTPFENACRAWGGHLPTINCSDELVFLKQQLHTGAARDYFVGGFRTADGQWHWADGSPWGFEPFYWEYGPGTFAGLTPPVDDSYYPVELQRLRITAGVAVPGYDPGDSWNVEGTERPAYFMCERTAP